MLLNRLVPHYEHWGDKWRATLLSSVLAAGLLFSLVALALELILSPASRANQYFLGGVIVFLVATWAIWHLLGLQRAANTFALGAWLLVGAGVLFSGGVNSSLTFGQLFVVLVAALLCSPRITALLVLATAGFNGAAIYLQETGQLPANALDETLLGRLYIQVAILVLSAAMILYSNRTVRELNQQVSENELKFRALFEKTTDAVFLISPERRLLLANRQATTLLGYKAKELEGLHIEQLFPEEEWLEVEERFRNLTVDQVLQPAQRRFLTKSGEEVILETNLALVVDEQGDLLHFQSIGRDITDKVLEEQRIRSTLAHMTVRASTDALTGLLNREAIMQHAQAEWERYLREDTPMSLMLVDMNGLKLINDTHGHLVGDAALKVLAQTLEKHKRPYDWIGRYGGDEFMMVLPGASWVDTQTILERMQQAAKMQSIRSGAEEIELTCSLGIASTDDPEGEYEGIVDLVRMADQALYKAKPNGQGLG